MGIPNENMKLTNSRDNIISRTVNGNEIINSGRQIINSNSIIICIPYD